MSEALCALESYPAASWRPPTNSARETVAEELGVMRRAKSHYDLDRLQALAITKDKVGYITALHESGHVIAALFNRDVEGYPDARFSHVELNYEGGKCQGGSVVGSTMKDDDALLFFLAAGMAYEQELLGLHVTFESSVRAACIDLAEAKKIL